MCAEATPPRKPLKLYKHESLVSAAVAAETVALITDHTSHKFNELKEQVDSVKRLIVATDAANDTEACTRDAFSELQCELRKHKDAVDRHTRVLYLLWGIIAALTGTTLLILSLRS